GIDARRRLVVCLFTFRGAPPRGEHGTLVLVPYLDRQHQRAARWNLLVELQDDDAIRTRLASGGDCHRWRDGHVRSAQDLIHAAIGEGDTAVAESVRQALTTLGPDRPTQLEDVRVVGVQGECHERALRAGRVVGDRYPLAKPVGDYALAHDAKGLPAEHDL